MTSNHPLRDDSREQKVWRGWTTAYAGKPVVPPDDDFHDTQEEAVTHAEWWNRHAGDPVAPRTVAVVECDPDAVVLVIPKAEIAAAQFAFDDQVMYAKSYIAEPCAALAERLRAVSRGDDGERDA